MKDIAGKTAIVTGGASGLGQATVKAFVDAGINVAIFDLNDESGEAMAASLGDGVIYCHTDVSDESSVQAALKVVTNAFGALHICINCAGIGPPEKVLSRKGVHSLATFNKVLQINLLGSFNVLRLAAEIMSKNAGNEDGEKGVVINTASAAAYDGQIGQAAYSASKGGIVGMTLPIARELASHGIRVNTIAPGLIETPLLASLPEAAVKSLVETIQFPKRFGKPEEYAELVMSLIKNAYMNGETIRFDASLRMPPR